MTSKHDGPRPGTPVTVIQAATPTRLTQAEAEELFLLTEAALKAQFWLADAMATHRVESPEYRAAQEASSEAYGALYGWQRDHGLTEEAWRRLK